MTDTRIVHGANCTWWDSINKVGKRQVRRGSQGSSGGLPCCPHCQGMLFEVDNEAIWFAGVDKHEAAGNPGYRTMVEWARGRCFRDYDELRAEYAKVKKQ